MKDRDALDAVRAAAQWFPGRSDGVADRPSDVLPALLYLIGDARVVLIGEATHGTDEFYSIRSALTKALIRSKQGWGELNLGQLARQRHADRVFLIGFTTHTGTVTAAREWDELAERRRVTPSLAGSYERLFHNTDVERFVLATSAARDALAEPRLERPIGVIYKPESERASHYFRAQMAEQFDAVIPIDTPSALTPLEQRSGENSDLPETYPTGV